MNWLWRGIAAIAGVVIAVIGILKLVGPTSLPACDASEAVSLAQQLAMNGVPPLMVANADKAKAVQDSIKVSDIAETSFDDAKQVRACTAALDLTVEKTVVFDKQKVEYRIEWENRDESRFTLTMQAL
jgi:hypothetical protein